jgi:hypothetical protein
MTSLRDGWGFAGAACWPRAPRDAVGAGPPATTSPTARRRSSRPFQDESQWIRETLWVETEFDSDRDGRPDRVFVGVARQRQTETDGLKVPVIYESSPYFAGTSGDRKFLWDVRQELGEPSPPRTSQPAIEFRPVATACRTRTSRTWVPRGFAVVHSDAPGTGCRRAARRSAATRSSSRRRRSSTG